MRGGVKASKKKKKGKREEKKENPTNLTKAICIHLARSPRAQGGRTRLGSGYFRAEQYLQGAALTSP